MALRHKWTGLTKRQTKEINPALVFTILGMFELEIIYTDSDIQATEAIWQYQSLHNGNLPNQNDHAVELESIANSMLSEGKVNQQVLTTIPRDLIEYVLRLTGLATAKINTMLLPDLYQQPQFMNFLRSVPLWGGC